LTTSVSEEAAMWNRPDADDDTAEFDAITDDGGEVLGGDPDDPPGWLVHGERAADGWVCIEIIPLAEGEQA
jgi:hypothetical protein